MAPAPANVRRHFLNWDQPLLGQAVAFLTRDWIRGPLDLSRHLVVVPTSQSGRRLREALAKAAADRGQAAISPRVCTPEALIAPGPDAGSASRLESLLAWVEILQALDLAGSRAVFPVDPPSRNFPWALRVAGELLAVQATLAEAELRFGDVPEKAGDFAERERWRQLGELERSYDEKLRQKGLRDAQAAKIAAVRHPSPIPGVEKIVVIGTPDAMALAVAALAARARMAPVDIVVFAPAGEAASFDGWGLPVAPAWANRPLDLPDFERRVRLCSDPSAQADEIASLARRYGNPEGILGIGAADGEALPALESALGRAGFAVFNPEGRPRKQDELYHLLAALAALAREPAFDAVDALGRCPAFIAHLRSRLGEDFSTASWLAGLDELRSRHLPADLAGARASAAGLDKFPHIAPALAEMEKMRAILSAGSFADGATSAMEKIFASRTLDLADPGDASLAASAEAWAEVVRGCAAAAGSCAAMDAWDLALLLFGETVDAGDKPAGALEILGWLELLWEDAPHLAVVGMNDGRVPEAIAGDPFLPESLREKLGLKTNLNRFARDAYILTALAACRAGTGRMDVLFGKVSSAGDPLRPSRLLLGCPDADLPARVDFLFRRIEADGPPLPWRRAWLLNPRWAREVFLEAGGESRVADPPSRVAVTALRDWLACPFRFYLRHVLRMSPFDAGKEELDDLDFGTLCHAALEAMGRSVALRDCTDPAELRDFLSTELDRRIGAHFGGNLTIPLIIQREAARQRLGTAAELQAAERAGGWRILDVEREIAVEVAGLRVSGKIDRIDRHVDTGAIRVLDYKTNDSAKLPAKAHLRAPRSGDIARDWAGCEIAGRRRVWSDLQLPFYRDALAAEFQDAIVCGYFNLPKAAGEAGLALWEDYPREVHASALRCVAGVCGAIRAGEFWPPNEKVRADRDDFASLFHHGAAASVDWEGRP